MSHFIYKYTFLFPCVFICVFSVFVLACRDGRWSKWAISSEGLTYQSSKHFCFVFSLYSITYYFFDLLDLQGLLPHSSTFFSSYGPLLKTNLRKILTKFTNSMRVYWNSSDARQLQHSFLHISPVPRNVRKNNKIFIILQIISFRGIFMYEKNQTILGKKNHSEIYWFRSSTQTGQHQHTNLLWQYSVSA